MNSDKPAYYVRLHKGKRDFLFVWQFEFSDMKIAEYINGVLKFTDPRMKVAGRKKWRTLIAEGFTAGQTYSLRTIPEFLTWIEKERDHSLAAPSTWPTKRKQSPS